MPSRFLNDRPKPELRGRVKSGAKLYLRQQVLDIPAYTLGVVTQRVGAKERHIELAFGTRRVCFLRAELSR